VDAKEAAAPQPDLKAATEKTMTTMLLDGSGSGESRAA
jgi:hypothetical protein